MKLTIGKQELIQALNTVQGVLEKTGESILSHIKLDVKTDSLSMTASNSQNIWITTTYSEGFTVEEEGSICIKGHRLVSIAKVLHNPSVVLSSEESSSSNETLNISNGKANFKILECKSASDYPPMPDIEDTITQIEIEDSELGRIIDETIFSIGNKERKRHNGVRIEKKQEEKEDFRMISKEGTKLYITQRKN